MLSEQAMAARREYKKKWARNNPEKVKAQQERYWQKKAEQQGKTASCRNCKHSENPGLFDGGCKESNCLKQVEAVKE